MQINFFPINFPSLNKKENCTANKYPNLAPLEYDTVSFGAMKKRDFKGVDSIVVNAFKAPIEKFNSNEDFQNWCLNLINEIKEKEYEGRNDGITGERRNQLEEWAEVIEKNNYTNAEALLILEGITRDLKQNNDNMPPVLSKSALRRVMNSIGSLTNTGGVNFKKAYTRQIANEHSENINTGWIIIKGKQNDPDNFQQNTEKFKALSCKTWCTTGKKAEEHLSHGDTHIYIENGKTKLSMAFKGDTVAEIQGELNNWRIPFKYMDEAIAHIENLGLKLSEKAKSELEETKRAKIELEKSKILLKDAIKKNDAEKIFEFFGIKTKREENGLLSISEYRQPEGFTFHDLGTDENKLLEQVTAIKGKARFYGSKATSLGEVKYIEGDADLSYSNIKTLNKLESTGGNLDLRFSSVSDLGNLHYVGGSFYNGGCPLQSLKGLETISKDADFRGGNLRDFGNLNHIERNAFVPQHISRKDYDFISRITECGIYYY